MDYNTILITGGAGFIGFGTVRRLVDPYPYYHIYNWGTLWFFRVFGTFWDNGWEAQWFSFWRRDFVRPYARTHGTMGESMFYDGARDLKGGLSPQRNSLRNGSFK